MVNTRSTSSRRGEREIPAEAVDASNRDIPPSGTVPERENQPRVQPDTGAPIAQGAPHTPQGDNGNSGLPVSKDTAIYIAAELLLLEESLTSKWTSALTRLEDRLAEQRVRISLNERRLTDATSQLKLLRTDVNSILENIRAPWLTSNENELGLEEKLHRLADRLETVESSLIQGTPAHNPRVDPEMDAKPSPVQPDKTLLQGSTRDTGTKTTSKSRKSSRKSGKNSKSRSRVEDTSSDSDTSESSDSSDTSLTSNNSSSTSEGRSRPTRPTGRGGVHSRAKGKKHPTLRTLRPTNHLYDVVLNYRYYRLKRRASGRTGHETGKVKDHIRRMHTASSDLGFDGSDPIAILSFLSRFVSEADILTMKESQALLALPYFLKKSALEHFRAARDAEPEDGGIASWPEAVQFLLRSYATNAVISEALLDLRDIRQKPGEPETDYSSRLMRAVYRCGNIHSADERMTMFVDGLNPAIRSLVARYREEQRGKTRKKRHSFTYLDLVRYAQNEGEALRARTGETRRSSAVQRDILPGNRNALPRSPATGAPPSRRILYLDSPEGSSTLPVHRDNDAPEREAVHLLHEENALSSSGLPAWDSSTWEESNDTPQDPILLKEPGMVPAPRVPFSNRFTRDARPGWLARPPVNRNESRVDPSIICHRCYGRGHLSTRCVHDSWNETGRAIRNFEALSVQEQSRVPADCYWRAKALEETVNPRARALRDALNAKAASEVAERPRSPTSSTGTRPGLNQKN